MGGSLLKGWISSKYKNISVIDPNKKVFKKINKVKYYNSISKIKDVSKFDVIFFAVKPQILNKVIKPYKKIIFKNILIVSIVAGKKVNYFEKEFGKSLGLDPARCYDNYISMAKNESSRKDGIEVVGIMTPSGDHYKIAKAFIEKKIHINR